MRKFILYLSMMFVFILGLTGCGGFVVDDTVEIAGINYQLLEDGRTMIVITYADEEVEPTVFYIPKGQEGNGIKNIYQTQSDDGKSTILQIHFTEKGKDPVFVNIPNAVSVTGMTSSVDLNGNTIIKFQFSNGTESEKITIPKGEKGEAGTTITDFITEELEDGSVKLKFSYSDGEIYEYIVPAPKKGEKGEDGKGIDLLQANTKDGKYILTVIYTDGTEQSLEFDMPEKPNAWLRGEGAPLNTLGKDGDFYFDFQTNTIYSKASGNWITVIDFEDFEAEYIVKFDKNAIDATLPFEDKEYKIKSGSYFFAQGTDVPLPQRAGYTFNGWFTTRTPSKTNGAFTDLTPVFGDLTLYANYTPIEYKIEYQLNGGSVAGYNPTTYTIESQDFVLVNPTKDGYKFLGWTTPTNPTPKLRLEVTNGSINNKIYIANWEVL